MPRFLCLATLLAAFMASPVVAQSAGQAPAAQAPAPTDVKAGSVDLTDVPYPYPVSFLPLTMYGQEVRMAYMDVPPAGQPNGRTVVLLHGMNFSGFYFAGPIEVLRKEGFRVVVTDQIGFGRSSKPIIPYNFHDMALNTRKVLQHLGIAKAAIVGHSMGGMLADAVCGVVPRHDRAVVIYSPIGVTDARWERPFRSLDDAYKARMAQTHDQEWQQAIGTLRRYFPDEGTWKPEYEGLARIMYAWTLSGEWPRLAMVRTLLAAAGLHGSSGVRLVAHQGESARHRRRARRCELSGTCQIHRGHDTGRATFSGSRTPVTCCTSSSRTSSTASC